MGTARNLVTAALASARLLMSHLLQATPRSQLAEQEGAGSPRRGVKAGRALGVLLCGYWS